jgi:hypothetical protein
MSGGIEDVTRFTRGSRLFCSLPKNPAGISPLSGLDASCV